MTNIKIPSLLNQISITQEAKGHIDLNKRFWRYLFSDEFYNKYININDEFIKMAISKVLDKDKEYISYLKDYKDTEILKSTHKFFYSIINFYNKSLFNKGGINLSITRNMIYGSMNNKLAKDIIYDVLNTIDFNDDSYSLKIYFDNEIHTSLIVAKYLKEKGKFVEIDTYTKSDEQVDFGSYSVLESHDFVDRVITYNNYKEFNPETFKINNSSDNLINGENSTSIRFFKNACFWNKCSFCTINAQHSNVDVLEKADKTIEKHIKYLKENPQLDYVFFTDEAIEYKVLLQFCKRVLQEGIDVKISIRARYEKKYKEEDVKLIGDAGIRFMGIGLESASSRLNMLIQKRDFELNIDEINKAIDLFNKYKINLHQYFMIGLPSETKEETHATLDFIKDNLKQRDYFTYSANVFSLNRGSDIYNNPDKYGIKLLEHDFKSQGVPFENTGDKTYPWSELKKMSNEIYSYMFFEEDYIQGKFNYGYSFWDFVDRTSIFYQQKLIFNKNPYLK